MEELMSYKIITDSATDLPRELIDKYQLHVIPTPVTINGTDYFDGKTIFPKDFYRIQAEGADIKTYHINQFMFRENFEPYAKAGEEVVYLCFSTGIAGTFNAANLAKEELLEEYPDFQITIIDSKCASMGFGLVVDKLLRMQANGASKELIIEAARFFCDNMEHIVTVDTLEYLYKGGRLSRTSAVLGGVLDIKPIIEVNDDGALVAFEKVRGRMKSLKRCVELVGERGVELEKQIIAIVHGNDKETCDKVKNMVMEQYHCKGIIESQVGCAIGAHTGPGIIGIVFLSASEEKYAEYLG
jgi:DegV family protein with EDD domain